MRELAELALKRQRRERRLIVVRTVAAGVGGGAMFALTRALLRHEPFDIATMCLYIAGGAVTYVLIWGGYLAWERLRRN